jgi:glycosyltransferase involved in cell wall biosynthesis
MTSRPAAGPTVVHLFSGDLWAGAEVMIFHLLHELHTQGGLSLVAFALNDGVLARRLGAIGVEVFVLPEARHSFAGLASHAYRLLQRRRVALIHSHRYKENVLATILSRALGVRSLVSTLHGLPEPTGTAPPDRLVDRLKRTADYETLKRCFTRVVAVSHEMKRTLVSTYRFRPERVEVIANGIPPVESPASFRPRAGRTLHVGTLARLVPVKDLELFLRVSAEIRRRDRNVHFSIAGDGPERGVLRRRAEELQVADEMAFLGHVPDASVYVRSLDLYLNTSKHEGLPLSVLEAMALGTPVVAPKVGGIPEVVTHGTDGLLVEGRDPASFAAACLRILSDDDTRHRLGAGARQTVVDRFASVTMAKAYHQLYLCLCGPS